MHMTLAVINQKGGVGKTTTSVNLSASLAALGLSVLLIDLDAQANATTSSLPTVDGGESMGDVLLGHCSMEAVVRPTAFGYAIAPASHALARTEWQLMQEQGREHRLCSAVATIKHSYNYIIIDAPPALNILSVNAIMASDELLVPVQCEYLALEGLSKLVKTLQALEHAQDKIIPFRLLRTLFDGRIRLSRQVSDELLHHFQQRVCHTIIPRTVRLAEAPSHAKPILYYDASSQGALTHLALASELVQKHQLLPLHAGIQAPSLLLGLI